MIEAKARNVIKAIETIPGLEDAITSKLDDRSLDDLISVVEAGGRIRDIMCEEIENIAKNSLLLINSLDMTRNDAIAYCILDDFYIYMISGQDNLPDTFLDWAM